MTNERVAHITTGATGAIVRRFESTGPYAGDLAGSWATVRFDDGETINCRAADLTAA